MTTVGRFAAAAGEGLAAGVVGTAAITASQMIAMKLRDGGPSDAPVKAAEKVLGVEPVDEEHEERVSRGSRCRRARVRRHAGRRT